MTDSLSSMNRNITMGDFQFIYGMEWAHRLLGRLTGLVFLGMDSSAPVAC